MSDILAWPYFQWIGAGVVGLLCLLAVAFLLLVVFAAWQAFGPRFICRPTRATNIWSTYWSDRFDGEGKRIKCNDDLRIVRLIGMSWRTRWFVGFISMHKDET